MEIRDMNQTEIEERLSAISTELEGLEDVEAVKTLNDEVDALNERKAELEDIEQRKADAEALASETAEAEVIEIVEERNEVNEMEKTYAIDTPEYREAWLKAQAGIQLNAEERSAMSTVDVVPTITVNTIINRLKNCKLLKLIDFTNYAGYVNIPCYSTNGDASWGASNEQTDAIGHVGLSLYQLIKTVEVPGTYDANSIGAFEAKMVEGLANKIEAALQTAVIVGAGSNSSQPTGINVTHSTADGTFTKAGITLADLLKIMGTLKDRYQKDACWIMPSKVFYEAYSNVTLHGFVNLAQGIDPIIAGKPVVFDDACVISSTDTIFYGAAKAYHMNLGSGGIKVDKDTSVGFKSNSVNFRAVCAADGKLDNAEAFVKFTRATA